MLFLKVLYYISFFLKNIFGKNIFDENIFFFRNFGGEYPRSLFPGEKDLVHKEIFEGQPGAM